LAHLRRAGAGQPALIGAALGLRDCIGQDGSRAAIRTALPFYLQGRGITRLPLAPLTSGDALRPGEFDDAEGFTVRFLEAVTRETEDACGALWTMEREWCAALMVVSRRLGGRSTSRLPWAIDMLAASPPLRVSALARLHDRGRLRDARRAGPLGDRRRGHRHDRARCMTPDPHPCGKDCCPPAPEGWTARATKKGIDATLRRTAHGWRMASIQGSGQMSHSLIL
jgi:hypothetical protein